MLWAAQHDTTCQKPRATSIFGMLLPSHQHMYTQPTELSDARFLPVMVSFVLLQGSCALTHAIASVPVAVHFSCMRAIHRAAVPLHICGPHFR